MFTPFQETAQAWKEKEKRRKWRSRWGDAFAASNRTDNEVSQARLKTAWRIIRTHAICKGQITPDERLAAIPEDQWHIPVPDASPKDRQLTAQLVADNFCGLSLLPDGYNYQKYTAAFFQTAKLLHIQDHDLIGFDEHVYPSRAEIIRFEYQFIHDLRKDYLQGGHWYLRERLDEFELTEPELMATILLVKAESTSHIKFDAEKDRRMMVVRLEDFLRRAQESADLRAEMQGIKALSVIQGLNRSEPENTITLVAHIARDLANAERKQLAGPNESGFGEDFDESFEELS